MKHERKLRGGGGGGALHLKTSTFGEKKGTFFHSLSWKKMAL